MKVDSGSDELVLSTAVEDLCSQEAVDSPRHSSGRICPGSGGPELDRTAGRTFRSEQLPIHLLQEAITYAFARTAYPHCFP